MNYIYKFGCSYFGDMVVIIFVLDVVVVGVCSVMVIVVIWSLGKMLISYYD